MNKFIQLITFLIIGLALLNCSGDNNEHPKIIELSYNFNTDTELWQGDFADYPVDSENFYELQFGFSNLPIPLNTSLGSLKQSGINRSDDLFMFIKRKISDLTPNTDYKISFSIEIATNAADGMVGVGGSPGEDVTIKAGATSFEPNKINHSGFYLMNLDKSNQANSGNDMKVIGDFSNDTNLNEYTFKQLQCNDCMTVKSDLDGILWVILGTDSGFESTTTIYYNSIYLKLEQ